MSRSVGIAELRAAYLDGKTTPSAVADSLLERASSRRELNCFIHLDATLIRKQAAAATERLRQHGNEAPPMTGIPVGVKDLLCTQDQPTTAGSKILDGFRPPYDATAVARLRAEGAILFGKLNLDEFAMGSSNETSAYGPVRNPWDIERAPGGSSGGSAAAVAARLMPVAFGTDTGGSIRQPASFCGVTGIKPTYGRVSRFGLIAFASSLDQIGPIGIGAEDCAHLLGAIAGHDPRDSTSAPMSVPDYVAEMKAYDLNGKTIGMPTEYFTEGLDRSVRDRIESVAAEYEKLGAKIRKISLPHTQYAIPTYYLVATSEASSNLARFDGIRYGHRTKEAGDLRSTYGRSRAEGFGREVKRRIMLGTFALSAGYYDAYYGKAQKIRTLLKRDFDEAFKQVDLILTPTSPSPAFKLGEKTTDPIQMYLSDVFTAAINLAGVPGISFPCGFVDGLPIGAQLIGSFFSESRLLGAAYRYQQVTEFHAQRPKGVEEISL